MGKAKIMTSEEIGEKKTVKVQGKSIEILPKEEATMHLGRLLSLQKMQDIEIEHRLQKGWKKFMSNKDILCGKSYPMRDRLRLFNATVTPTVLYGCGSWTMTDAREND